MVTTVHKTAYHCVDKCLYLNMSFTVVTQNKVMSQITTSLFFHNRTFVNLLNVQYFQHYFSGEYLWYNKRQFHFYEATDPDFVRTSFDFRMIDTIIHKLLFCDQNIFQQNNESDLEVYWKLKT